MFLFVDSDESKFCDVLMVILCLHGRLCGILPRSRTAFCRFSHDTSFGTNWNTMEETPGNYGGITSINVIITYHKK